MAQTSPTAPSNKHVHHEEGTFRNYDAAAAARYAAFRKPYNPKLIALIVKTHISTGGGTNSLLDIGCGPGLATKQLSPFFEHVAGVDAGQAMVEQAQQNEIFTSTGKPATFSVCTAEEIDKNFQPESIDLITAATAAHWFDMEHFYPAAARVLKPGGSIAMWCSGSLFIDPATTPNAENVQALLSDLENSTLRPFEVPGNARCRELYIDLLLPWTIDTSSLSAEDAAQLAQFEKSASMRREFNADGQPDPDPILAETQGFMYHQPHFMLSHAAKVMGTSSQVTRWRVAHKEQLDNGEIEDCIERMLRLTKEEMSKVPEGVGREWIDCNIAMVLIVVKKKSA